MLLYLMSQKQSRGSCEHSCCTLHKGNGARIIPVPIDVNEQCLLEQTK